MSWYEEQAAGGEEHICFKLQRTKNTAHYLISSRKMQTLKCPNEDVPRSHVVPSHSARLQLATATGSLRTFCIHSSCGLWLFSWWKLDTFFHFNKGALHLMDDLEIGADAKMRSSLFHSNNKNASWRPPLIQSSKQQYKQTSAHFTSISGIGSFI